MRSATGLSFTTKTRDPATLTKIPYLLYKLSVGTQASTCRCSRDGRAGEHRYSPHSREPRTSAQGNQPPTIARRSAKPRHWTASALPDSHRWCTSISPSIIPHQGGRVPPRPLHCTLPHQAASRLPMWPRFGAALASSGHPLTCPHRDRVK